jgi:hypothetical protein
MEEKQNDIECNELSEDECEHRNVRPSGAGIITMYDGKDFDIIQPYLCEDCNCALHIYFEKGKQVKVEKMIKLYKKNKTD